MSLRVFAVEALADFHTTAAISPGSKHLASAMSEPLPLARARVAVEFGAGTGAITRALLDELSPSARLLVFEVNPRFVTHLKSTFSDPRLVVIHSSVENVDRELCRRGCNRVDAVASSLGLGFIPEPRRHALFRRLVPFLHEKSVLTQYQYIHGLQFENGRLRRLRLQPLLRRYFDSVQLRVIWRNLPPAFVFTCHRRRPQIRPARLDE